MVERLAHGYFENTACAEYQPPDCAETWNLPLSAATSAATAVLGAGGRRRVANARDVDTWMRAVFAGRVVPPEQQAEWLQMVSTTTGEPIADVTPEDPQGFALGLAKAMMDPDGGVWFYQGTTLGYRTLYVWFEAEDMMITVQTNSQPDDDEGELHDAVIGDLRRARRRPEPHRARAGRSPRARRAATRPASRAPSGRAAGAASRGDVGERPQHEAALVQPRVRQQKAGRRLQPVAPERAIQSPTVAASGSTVPAGEQVEVAGPRPPAHRPAAAELALDLVQRSRAPGRTAGPVPRRRSR